MTSEIPLLSDEITTPMSVWAQAGSYGWRPAVVIGVQGRRRRCPLFRLQFESGRKGNGSREASELRRRDPRLKGRDKPRPPWIEKAEMQEAQDEENAVGAQDRINEANS